MQPPEIPTRLATLLLIPLERKNFPWRNLVPILPKCPRKLLALPRMQWLQTQTTLPKHAQRYSETARPTERRPDIVLPATSRTPWHLHIHRDTQHQCTFPWTCWTQLLTITTRMGTTILWMDISNMGTPYRHHESRPHEWNNLLLPSY